jgi:pimeloyl-ACP methyl ester carboxylesterase
MTALNRKPLILFAHGKESGPWGTKIKHLADIAEGLGCNVLSPDYSDLLDPDARVQRLLSMDLTPHNMLVLVGSSMGGYVSTVVSQKFKPTGLFLMAPAFYLPGYAEQAPVSGADRTCVVFGWQDEVIPVEHGIRFAQAQRAKLHVMDGDHRLKTVLAELGALFEQFLVSVLNSTHSVKTQAEGKQDA